MNFRPHNLSDPSQSDADFLVHLTDFAETIEPDPTFKASLEVELLQTHPSNSSQTTTNKRINSMNFVFPRLNHRTSLVVCASLAIAAAFIIPTLHLVIGSNASAQTIAQAFATGQVTLISDTQEYNETTQEIVADGNAVLAFPSAQVQAKADRITYFPTAKQFTLLGNIEILQRGENLRGSQANCSLAEKQFSCSLAQK